MAKPNKIPVELINEILNSGEYGQEDIEFAKSVASQFPITMKQWVALNTIVLENEMAKAGYIPYGPDYAYRVGL